MAGVRIALALVIFVACLPPSATAQVMATAETTGHGKNSVQFGGAYQDEGDDGTHVPYLSYTRGLGPMDIFTSVGGTFRAGHRQAWVSSGGNLKLVRIRGTSFSVLATVRMPVTGEGSEILLNTAAIMSQRVGSGLELYVRVNERRAVGKKGSGIFAQAKPEYTVPIGAAIRMEPVTMFVELERLKGLAVGFRRTF